jgi:membrane protease YdiL (CAAX protease family)
MAETSYPPPMSSIAPDAGPPPWKPWTAPAALGAALLLAIFGGLVVAIVGAIFGASIDDPPPSVTIVATFVQDGAFIGSALAFAGRAGPVPPARFGLRPVAIRKALGWMALAFGVYLACSAAWIALLDLHQQDTLPDELGVDKSTAALVSVCVLVTVVAPIAEELFFRGFFFGALRNWHGPWLAALLTGLVFGGIHAFGTPAGYLLPLAVLGFMLCVVRWRTGSLLPCMALHAINNGLAFGVSQDWVAWQVLLLIAGATAVVVLAVTPFVDREPAGRALI